MPETSTRTRARRPRARTAAPAGPASPEPPAGRRGSTWLKGIGPLLLLAVLVLGFLRFGPVGVFRKAFPPVEELTVERITIPAPGELRVRVVNSGPEPTTIAQVLVDDAIWAHTLDGPRTLGRLERRTLTIPYPWVEGEPVVVTLVTSTGLTFGGEVAVATESPRANGQFITTFALLGIYAGVIPVFLGLLWLPFLRTLRRRWLDFFLSLTVGLLVFLGVDALAESLEFAGALPGPYQGVGLVLLGVVGTPLALGMLGRRGRGADGVASPLAVATLIAVGIGLHNLGEGLLIGSAYATGEIALGTFLVIGFLIHNTTEGLGIVAPLARERPTLARLLLLGALAGLPTIAGAWLGGFTYSPFWTTLFFAVGVGAIVQVVWVLSRMLTRGEHGSFARPLTAAGLLVGMLIMYATGLLVPA